MKLLPGRGKSSVIKTVLPVDLTPIWSGMEGDGTSAATAMTLRRAITVDLEKSISNDEREWRGFCENAGGKLINGGAERV